MSLDLPASLERDIEEYAREEQISTKEAAVKLLSEVLKSKKRKAEKIQPLTDEELNQLKALDGSYGLLEDVSDEKIDRMATTISRMKQDGFSKRA